MIPFLIVPNRAQGPFLLREGVSGLLLLLLLLETAVVVALVVVVGDHGDLYREKIFLCLHGKQRDIEQKKTHSRVAGG